MATPRQGEAAPWRCEKALSYLDQALDNPLMEVRHALGDAVQSYAVGDQADTMLDLDRAEDFLNQALKTHASAGNDRVRALLLGLRAAKQ